MNTTRTIAGALLRRENIAFFFISLSISLGAYYIFLINQTVINAAEELRVQGHISELKREIAELEFAYIERENTINIDYAYSLGFKDVQNRQFVTRTTSLTLR